VRSSGGWAFGAGLLVPVVACCAALVACALAGDAQRGAACDRASDCAGGLFCVNGTCSDDLSKLDAGRIPNFQPDAPPDDVAEEEATPDDTTAPETSPPDVAPDVPPREVAPDVQPEAAPDVQPEVVLDAPEETPDDDAT
jgi:hypothetical protein